MKFVRLAFFVVVPVMTLTLGFGMGSLYQERVEDRHSETPLIGSGATIHADPEKEVSLSLLWDVWRLLERRYAHPEALDPQKMVYGAISGLVASLGDPYTLFMTPKESKTFDDTMTGTLEGIGAQLDFKDGNVTVVAPLKGSPAEKAGMLPKDVIREVEGQSIQGLSLEEVVGRIRGPKGTAVTLGILRGAPPLLTKTLTRESIHIPTVESSTVKGKKQEYFLITVNQFGADTVESVKESLENRPPKTKGIILDLRFNGGGYLDGAIDITSFFVKDGPVVTVERRDMASQVYTVTGKPLEPTIPLIVLVNGGSASASEIVAGALQDTKRATIVGTQTFGKGTVQEVIGLTGGASLRLTVARWLTPAGHDLGKKGVTPDVIIDRTTDQMKAGVDPQKEKALDLLDTASHAN